MANKGKKGPGRRRCLCRVEVAIEMIEGIPKTVDSATAELVVAVLESLSDLHEHLEEQ